uniref:Endonuclease/exonuclease/phosphatase domain-containing protein n=1 Tax=Oncorhynchus mykiss TaxID=8022 RepID=A0A8K9UJX4_ONCMY
MTFPEADPLFGHHPGQWIGSQPATQNNGAAEGGDGVVFWSGSIDVTSRTSPEHTTTYHTAPEHTTTYHTAPEHTTTYHTAPEHTTTYHTAPEHTTTYHTAPEHTTTYHTAPEHTTTYHTVPEHTTTYHTVPEHTTTYHTAPEHTTTYHTAPEHTTTYHTVPEHTTTYHTAPEHTTTYHTVPEHTTTYHTVPEHTTTYHTAPEHTTTYHTAPEHTTTYHTVPEHTTTYHTAPEHTTTYHTVPEHTTTYHTVPEHTTTYHTVPEHTTRLVQSLDNKVDEIRSRLAFQRDIRDCNILCFPETWLTRDMLSESVQPPGFFTHRADRNKHLSGKKKGVCLMINKTWCDHNNIQDLKSFCSPDLDFLTIKCRLHYLPREFSSIIITVVYIPPQADTSTPLKELPGILCKLETIYPEAAFIVAGDFNKANPKTRLPKFYQHIECATQAGNILDHCHSNFREAYKAFPRPFFKSDHDSILLLPAYRQKLKQETPVLRFVQRWSDQSDSTIDSCL